MSIIDFKQIAAEALIVSKELRRLGTEMRVFCTKVVNIEAEDKDGVETVLKPEEMKTRYMELRAQIAAIEFPTKVTPPEVDP